MKWLRAAALLLAVLAVAAVLAFRVWRARGISHVQRGYNVAAAHGCFACHGPGGTRGFADESGAMIGDVPPFAREELEAYARDEGEIREWITDGVPRRLRDDPSREGGPARVFVMPAFGDILSPTQVDDLVAYVVAVTDFQAPESGPLAEGRKVAARFGCFTCHGPQGRGSIPNPRSLKGHVPSWDGPDYPDLANDPGEVREWILDGGPARLRAHPVARYFLTRQALQMPSYRGRVTDADVETLVRYIDALRSGPAATPPPPSAPPATAVP